ncbi:hypothetical protein Ancab_033332 [Ancistrocladus abbreviatus]
MWNGRCNGEESLRTFVRYFSRKCAPNLRKINPKLPPLEASSVSQTLYHIIKQHGPLTVSSTWIHAKEAGVSSLNSKTHMKIMLKWMRGRKMLKQFYQHVGSNKRFLLGTLPEEPKSERANNSAEQNFQIEQPSIIRKKYKAWRHIRYHNICPAVFPIAKWSRTPDQYDSNMIVHKSKKNLLALT